MNTEQEDMSRPAGGRNVDDDGRTLPRREFLRRAAIASAGAFLVPSGLFAGNGTPLGACTPTSADIEGPYYMSGSPMRVALARDDEPGEKLQIGGIVYANDCITPIAGATVDVWAANDAGCYNNNNECSPHGDDTFNLRGRMLTNASGAYAFSTVKPGRYLNGATYRPSHVHFKVSAPGRQPMTTQLYFTGDPFNAGDPWASDPDAVSRVIPLNTSTQGLVGTFDIVLNVAPPQSGVHGGTGAALDACALLGALPNPFAGFTVVRYVVAHPVRVDLAVYDSLGRRVRTLVSSVHGAGEYSDVWNGADDGGAALPSGTYVCRLQAGTTVDTQKIVLAR